MPHAKIVNTSVPHSKQYILDILTNGSFPGIGCHFSECDSLSNYCECDILANFNPVFQEI